MKKCRQPGEGAGDDVASEQWALAEKERQVSSLEILQPYGKGLIFAGFQGEADSGEVEMCVMAGNQNLGQAPEEDDKDQNPGHQKASVLLRQGKLRGRHVCSMRLLADRQFRSHAMTVAIA